MRIAARAAELAEIVDRPLGDEHPFGDHQRTVTRRFDLGEDVAREEHGVIAAELAYERPHVSNLIGVEPGGRLVEDQDLRPRHERVGQAHALPVPLGEMPDELFGHVGYLGALHGKVDRSATHLAGDTLELGAKLQVLAHPHLWIKRHGFGHVADGGAGLGGMVDEIVPPPA